MAYQGINSVCKQTNFLIVLIIVTTCFSAICALDDYLDEDYYELSEDVPQKKEHHLSKGNNLSAERKLQDYLLSIDSRVFANNDVLTVKERHPPVISITKKPENNKFTVHETKPSSFIEDIQSDQPLASKWKQEIAQPEYSQPSSEKPSTATLINKNKQSVYTDPYRVNASSSGSSIDRKITTKAWNCQFRANNDCEIVNDLAVGNFFHLQSQNLFRDFQAPSWYLLLNASTMPESAAGARLITPYMETQNASQGCLSVHFITLGSGVTQVNLYQQDKGNFCIWSRGPQLNYPNEVPVNSKFEFTIDLFRGSPRFFLELYLDLSRSFVRQSTIFALAKMRLTYQSCSIDNRNHCRSSSNQNEYENVMP